MKHPACITVFIFLAVFPGRAQEQENAVTRILLQGVVMDSETLEPLPNSQVFVNRRFNSLTDENGAFGVYVNLMDSLTVTRLGYQPAALVVVDSLTKKPYIAGIFLSTDTIEIAEVVIIPRLQNLRSEMLNPKMSTSQEVQNARYNVAVAAYAGRTTTGRLGDPDNNYRYIREQQKVNAYERGQIPSDRIAGLSPFMLLPALDLLINGLPEPPPAFKPEISDYELQQIRKVLYDRRRE